MGSENSKKINTQNKNPKNSNVFKEEEKNESHSQSLNNLKEPPPKQNQRMITVTISLDSKLWEKSYNSETPLNIISSDFQRENGFNLPKNCFLEFSFKNSPIDMDSKKLKTLVDEDTNQIILFQEIKPIPGTDNLENDEKLEIVGKPFSDPFEIFTFEIKKKIIKIRLYNKDKIKQIGLDYYGIDSAYCNGNNHLFISGGVNRITDETIGLFWDIDLINNVFRSPIEMFPKKNHSMIYIEKKVYIIGGDDVNTLYYDEDTNEITKWSDLNYKRFEPSLIKHDNYLFCFDTSKKYLNNFNNIFNFEKIDLNKKKAEWEVINPQISPSLLNIIFCQKFFGIVEDFRQNIIFFGGIYDNDNKAKEINNNEYMNIQYNINNNTIEKSDIEFKNISFGEKAFLPLDYKTYFVLPNFNKHSPKVIYYLKDKNNFQISLFHPKTNRGKKFIEGKITQIKPSLKGLNFDMPNFENENNLNNSNFRKSNREEKKSEENSLKNYRIDKNIEENSSKINIKIIKKNKNDRKNQEIDLFNKASLLSKEINTNNSHAEPLLNNSKRNEEEEKKEKEEKEEKEKEENKEEENKEEEKE